MLTSVLLFNLLKYLIMGQYLTIGIVTKFMIGKARAKQQASATTEEVREALQMHHNQSGIYNLEEDEGGVWLSLKPEIAEAELIEFLKDFYALRYPDEKLRNTMVRMSEIESRRTLDEWMELASNKRCQAFQLDDFVFYYTPFPRGWTDSLDTRVEQIILSLDGKIIMECYGDLFEFFTNLIKERLSKYRLANSLLVNISG